MVGSRIPGGGGGCTEQIGTQKERDTHTEAERQTDRQKLIRKNGPHKTDFTPW